MAAKVEYLGGDYILDIKITGTKEEVTEAVDKIYGQYPTPGYGTWFNWPPGGENKRYKVPKANADGTWTAYGHHSTSCE